MGELRNEQAFAQINPSMARLKKARDGEKNAAAKKVRMEDLSVWVRCEGDSSFVHFIHVAATGPD